MIMQDTIFGELSFRVGWTKKEILPILGKDVEIRVRTSSLKNEVPSEVQQKSYMRFKQNSEIINRIAYPKVTQFIKGNECIIKDLLGINVVDDPYEVIQPVELLLFKSSKYAIIFDTKWSEDGMVILIDGESIEVGDYSIIEFEI